MSTEELVNYWRNPAARAAGPSVIHPSGDVEQELAQALSASAGGRTITYTSEPINCTRVASGSLCCC